MAWPPPNFHKLNITGRGTHQRDPVSRDWWFFFEGDHEKDARTYYELALRYQISFQGICTMAAALLKEHYDLQKELDAIGEEAKRDAELLRSFKLPLEEVVAIWERSREGMLRLAELFPEKREKYEAGVREAQDVMLAIFERYERKEETH
jgi:hypothetical protein